MKTIGCILFLFYGSFTGFAQITQNRDLTQSQYYLGVKVNTIDYNLYFNKQPIYGYISSAPVVHIGLRLTNKSALQIGLAYGANKITVNAAYFDDQGRYIENIDYRTTKALLVPLTWRYTLNPANRLQFFGSASVEPAYGVITSKKILNVNTTNPTTYQEKVRGLNAFVSGSIGINLKISKRWEGYGESIIFHRSIKGTYRLGYFNFIGFGINYNLFSD